MDLYIYVMTPQEILWEGSVHQIILQTNSGQMGVLKNHVSLATSLEVGVLLIQEQEQGDWLPIAVMGGFAKIHKNKVFILVNDAEFAALIEKDEAEQAFNLAKIQMQQAISRKEKLEAKFVFMRAQVRYKAIKKLTGYPL